MSIFAGRSTSSDFFCSTSAVVVVDVSFGFALIRITNLSQIYTSITPSVKKNHKESCSVSKLSSGATKSNTLDAIELTAVLSVTEMLQEESRKRKREREKTYTRMLVQLSLA